jgi:N-acetylglucosamine-6-phosphate deacetylase
MLIAGAKVFTKEHRFQKLDIEIAEDKIASLRDSEGANSIKDNSLVGVILEGIKSFADGEILDASGLYAIPGLVDIHFHGAVGHDFCDADMEGLSAISVYEAQNGVLAICPATMTYSEEILEKVMTTAREYASGEAYEEQAQLVGINMEGPFISPEKIGAQNPKYLAKPDVAMFRRLQEKSGNLIRLLDIAPEIEGSSDFIKELSHEVNISIAHTACTYEEAVTAFDEGARHVTHLFNAMPGINHRKPGPIPAAMEKNAEVELIADGIHVHPAMVRFVFETMPDGKVILISDSMEATGLPDGIYQLGGQSVTVCGQKAVLTDDPGTIAGSVTNLFQCMKNAINMGVNKEAAIMAASENAARAIGVGDKYGCIEAGFFANILLVDENMKLMHVINRGKVLF